MRLFDSRLHVLHLFYKNSLQQEQLQAALGTRARQLYDIDYKVLYQLQQDTAEGIQGSFGQQQADLLALIPQKHYFLEKHLHKSLTHKIISSAFVPLLSLPADALKNNYNAPARVAEVHL